MGISREEPVDETHLVDNKKAEGQAEHAREQSQSTIEVGKAAL